MKHILNIFIFFVAALIPTFGIGEIALGHERINPLQFPKFTVGGEYAMMRNFRAFNGSDLTKKWDNSFGLDMHAEAGILNYLNAGLTVSFTENANFLLGSNIVRIGLFLKPYLPLGERISFFARLGLGGSISLGNEAVALVNAPGAVDPEMLKAYHYTYGNHDYSPISVGINGSALVGLEAFLTSRLGLVAEWGIRADMLWAGNVEYESKNPKRRKPGEPGSLTDYFDPKSGEPLPSWFHYLIYDMPLIVSINFIF